MCADHCCGRNCLVSHYTSSWQRLNLGLLDHLLHAIRIEWWFVKISKRIHNSEMCTHFSRLCVPLNKKIYLFCRALQEFVFAIDSDNKWPNSFAFNYSLKRITSVRKKSRTKTRIWLGWNWGKKFIVSGRSMAFCKCSDMYSENIISGGQFVTVKFLIIHNQITEETLCRRVPVLCNLSAFT